MKKIYFAMAACAMFAFAACNSATTATVNTDSLMKDSIAKVEAAAKQKMDDSMANAAKADTTKKDAKDAKGAAKPADEKKGK